MINVAIVGCGAIGRRHAEKYGQIDGVNVVGCCDVTPSAATQMASDLGIRSFKNISELLEQPLDGVSVCTPPDSHVEIAANALGRGIRVLCEKPLAKNVKECQNLVSTQNLACAFKFRHLSGAQRLRDEIAAGELGQILAIRGTAVSNLDMSGRWFSNPQVSGGGVLLDNGVHLIDLCRFLLGPVESVSATMSEGSRGLEVEESASIYLRLSGSVAVQLLVSWEAPAPMPPLLEVYGTQGYAQLGYDTEVFDATGKQRLWHMSGEGVDIWRNVIANFVEFVAGRSEPSAQFEDGFAAVATAEAAYRSCRTGQWEIPAVMAELVV